MARVTDRDNAAPQIGRPVGSLQELKDLEVPTRNIASCSEPEGNKNAGCPVWKYCDRAYRGTRPQMEVVRKVNRKGQVRVYEAPCFDTVLKESSALENRELYDVIGHEGDEYTYKGSVKLHEKRDPSCNDCAQGKCEKYRDRNDLKAVCSAFPQAGDHPELVMFSEMISARKSTGVRQKEAIRESLLPGSGEGKTINVAKGDGRGARSAS